MTEQDPKKQKLKRHTLSYWFLFSSIMATAGLVTFLIIGILFFAPEVLPITPPPPPAVVERVDTLSSQVTDLNEKVESLEKKNQAIKPGLLQNRLSSLEARLADLSGSTEKMQDVIKGLSEIRQDFQNDGDIVQTVTKMSKLVTTLDSRVETLATDNQEIKSNLGDFNPEDIKAANMLLVATQFQGSVERGIPFSEELEAIKALFNTDAEAQETLMRLQPFAGQGVPSQEELMAEFDSLSNDLIKAAIADDRTTVRNTVKSKLSKYIKIYQEDAKLPIDDTQAILRQARNNLNRGDVSGAILALSEVKGPTAKLIEPFFNKAEAHVLADRLSKKISKNAIDFIRQARVSPQNSTSEKLF